MNRIKASTDIFHAFLIHLISNVSTLQMGDKAKIGHKKKHVSKHVIKAREEKNAIAMTPSSNAEPSSGAVSTPTKRKQRKNRHVKDPNEAATYLLQWKDSKSGNESGWKFNKNTQSWLIRHMYEADKVPKSVFTLLLEYLDGLEGEATTAWLRSDASRRALRYKGYERGANTQGNLDKRTEAEGDTSTSMDEREEQSRWVKLNDHEKRKEYKRARQVLERKTEPLSSMKK
jgi:WKF domain